MPVPVRLLAGSSSALLALVLSSPGVAWADRNGPNDNASGGQQQAQESRDGGQRPDDPGQPGRDNAEDRAEEREQEEAERAEAAEARERERQRAAAQRERAAAQRAEAAEKREEQRQRAAARRAGAQEDRDRGRAQAGDRREANRAQAAKPRPKPQRPAQADLRGQGASPTPGEGAKGDPPGNNGTIKVDYVPADSARANRPHPGCAASLTFFNFDANQHADITFTSIAPTGDGDVVKSYTNQVISTSPADGGMESEHTIVVTADDLGLSGTAPHKQGWHVKVAVDSVEAPGGAKQKVFWLSPCEQDGVTQQEAAGFVLRPALGSAALRLAPTYGSATLALTPVAAERAVPATLGSGTATVTQAKHVHAAMPSSLAMTGPGGLAEQLTAAIGALLVGAFMVMTGRRRRVTA